MTPDIIFSEYDRYEIYIDVNQMHGPVELEIMMHQNI